MLATAQSHYLFIHSSLKRVLKGDLVQKTGSTLDATTCPDPENDDNYCDRS